jgi:predicted ArsR family transcriptional regulator
MTERLDAAGDPKLRRALLYARSQGAPLSADDAATALGVHRNVARAWLDRLASAGFLRVFFERRSGRSGPGAGRPAKLYEVAAETELLEFPPRRLDELTRLLAEQMDEQALTGVGREYGRLLARAVGIRRGRDRRRAIGRLCDALAGSGFQVSLASLSKDEIRLSSPTCPMRPLVHASPAATGIDRGMWSALLAEALSGAEAAGITCETAGCSNDAGSCEIVIRLNPPVGDSPP